MRFIIGIIMLQISSAASAELMGMVPGRDANLPQHAPLSIEVGASWYTEQLQWAAARINFKPSRNVEAYLDIAQLRATNLPTANARVADFSGVGFGGGVIFAVPDVLTGYDIAFQAAYHSSVIDESGSGTTSLNTGNGDTQQTNASVSRPTALEQEQWSAEFLLSPIDPTFENGATWYTTFGFVSTAARTKATLSAEAPSTAADFQKISGAAIGAGLVKPTAKGHIYLGLEWLSGDPLIGLGYRRGFR